MGSGAWTGSGDAAAIWDITDTTNLTFSASGLLRFSGALTAARTLRMGALTYNNIQNSTTGAYALILRDACSGNALTVDANRTQQFYRGETRTFASYDIGTGCTLSSDTTSQATIAKSGGGTVTITGATISYLIGSPASTFYAPGCIDGGNNTNISFIVTTTRSVGLDALIAATATRSVGLDALIATTNTRSVGLDALIISTPSAGHTVKYLPRTVGVAAPARVREVAA